MKPLHWFAAGCIAVCLLVCSFMIGRATAPIPEAEIIRDTTIRVVPMWKDRPQPKKTTMAGYITVPAYRFLSDTVTNEITQYIPVSMPDSPGDVYLPREQKFYSEEDGRLRLWVSGYDPQVDRYEIDWEETTITNTVYPKQKRWNVSVSAGYGFALGADGKLKASAVIAVTAGYAIFSW